MQLRGLPTAQSCEGTNDPGQGRWAALHWRGHELLPLRQRVRDLVARHGGGTHQGDGARNLQGRTGACPGQRSEPCLVQQAGGGAVICRGRRRPAIISILSHS